MSQAGHGDPTRCVVDGPKRHEVAIGVQPCLESVHKTAGAGAGERCEVRVEARGCGELERRRSLRASVSMERGHGRDRLAAATGVTLGATSSFSILSFAEARTDRQAGAHLFGGAVSNAAS